MKRPGLYTWIILVLIFILNQLLERIFHFYYPVLFSYLDDLICIPIILGTYQLITVILRKQKRTAVPIKFIFISVLLFSVWFEVILPSFSPKYTGDAWDVLMYICGGVFYYLFFNSNLLFKGYANKKKIRV